MCVRVLYCNLTCARAHKEEHRPVCTKHANWVDEAPVADMAGAPATYVDLLGDEEPQEEAPAPRQAAAAQADEYAEFDAEHAQRARRLKELDRERAALMRSKNQKRKRAEGGDVRKVGKQPKGGKSPNPGGKGKAGKGAAKACYGCQSTEHVVADCELTKQVMRMQRAGGWP